MDRDLILGKISSIKKCLKRIKDTTDLDPESLEDLNTQDLFVLQLQRAVQSYMDVVSHIVSAEDLGLPQSSADAVDLLVQNKILDKDFAIKLKKMIGFRNIAVHEYQEIDIEILKKILKFGLKDLEDFCDFAAGQIK